MGVRPIVKWGQRVLHEPARTVEKIDDEIRKLVVDMVDTMYAAPGIGLAAPQIGVPLRVVVIDLSVGDDPAQLIKLVNPACVETDGEQRIEEGCLSAPGFCGVPVRPARIKVKGLDLDGNEMTYDAMDLLARAFCHEIDHTDGLLFVDRLSPLKRDLLKRRLRKKAKGDDWDD